MKRHLSVLFISYFLLTACHHTTSEQKALLVQADGLIAARPDSALHLLKKIGYYNYLSSPDRARYALLMTQALDKCDSVVESDSLIQVATDYYGKGDPVHAGYAWFYRSRCENNRGDAQEQAKALLKAQEYATQSKDYKLLGFVYGDKATIFQQQNQVDSMLHYNLLAYSNLKKAGDKRNCIVCLLIIGYSHYLNKQYEAALKYADLAFNECDNAEPLLITSIHRQQCLTYYGLKDYHKALRFARLSTASSDVYDYNKAINLAMIFNKLNRIDSACYYLRKCKNPHEMASEYYQTWLAISAKQKKYDAIVYYADKLVTAKDSLNKSALAESFAGLERKYNYEGVVLRNESLTIRNQYNNMVILLLLLSISIGVVTFTLFKDKQHKKMLDKQFQLTAKEKELSQQAQERVLLLQKQINTQYNALNTLNKMEMVKSSRNKDTRNNRLQTPFYTEKEQGADSLIKHVIENIDLLHDNISKRLIESFPDLQENEVMICCFLLAGFDNVTIYTTLNLQSNSYNVKRTGLRKKLGLPHEMNLTDFLAKF